jgi:hypothetical protein
MRRTSSVLASRGIATMRLRGTMICPAVRSAKSIAREAISPATASTEPVSVASSTICWISPGERRASVKVVLSPKTRSTTLELAVSSHTMGRIACESRSSGRAMSSA